MNFNYSYRAFLITCLMTGILVLLFTSIKLSNISEASQGDTYDIVVAPEEIWRDRDIASIDKDQVKIETNKAYNEAEKFISSVENENRKITETTEGKLEEMERAIENAAKNPDGIAQPEKVSRPKREKSNFSNSDSNKKLKAIVEGGNRNTTISYRLVDRQDMYLPNPVYTCYGAGQVVINIEVDNSGKVEKVSFNQNASSTSNQCLVDAAMEYALQTK